jgi:hypothetical protein
MVFTVVPREGSTLQQRPRFFKPAAFRAPIRGAGSTTHAAKKRPFIEWALTKGPWVAYINMKLEEDAFRSK